MGLLIAASASKSPTTASLGRHGCRRTRGGRPHLFQVSALRSASSSIVVGVAHVALRIMIEVLAVQRARASDCGSLRLASSADQRLLAQLLELGRREARLLQHVGDQPQRRSRFSRVVWKWVRPPEIFSFSKASASCSRLYGWCRASASRGQAGTAPLPNRFCSSPVCWRRSTDTVSPRFFFGSSASLTPPPWSAWCAS
jgi:hypothetical protein